MSAQQGDKSFSLRALARHLRVNDNAVRKAVASKRLDLSIFHNEAGRPFVKDLELAATEWHANAGRPRRADAHRSSAQGAQAPECALVDDEASFGTVISAKTLIEAQRLATLQRERKLRLENDVAAGRLVPVARVEKEAFEAQRVMRESFLNLPARYAAELHAIKDATQFSIRFTAVIHEALNLVADQLVAGANG